MQGTLTDIIPFTDLDADGAIEETAGAAGVGRSDFMKRGAVGGLGLLAGEGLLASMPSLASAKSLPKSDVAILNYALTLEYLEAAFYKGAVAKGGLTGRTKAFAKLVAHHEATHVSALKQVLGGKAVKSPKFDFGSAYKGNKAFQQTAYVLENTGVKAYLGQAGKIKTPAILGAAASIVTIEARHAALIAEIIGGPISKATPSGSFDASLSKTKVLAAVKKTGFIVG